MIKIHPILDQVKNKIKNNKIVKRLLKGKNLPHNFIELLPMCFSDELDVSARTQHGIIYFNIDLLKGRPEELDHYMVHELTHVIQQTTGDGPTTGSAEDDYLDNEFEQEGFQTQTEYLSDTRDDEVAKKYIKKVLDHHEVPRREREEKEKDLLRLAGPADQLSFVFNTKPAKSRGEVLQEIREFMEDFEGNLAKVPINPSRHLKKEKLHPLDQSYRLKKIKELLSVLPDKKE